LINTPKRHLGIIGPNGAGKTTLLEAVAGMQPVDKGHVRWHGKGLRAALDKTASTKS
jgi:ABC-2 type transport system ATP-binding protein